MKSANLSKPCIQEKNGYDEAERIKAAFSFKAYTVHIGSETMEGRVSSRF